MSFIPLLAPKPFEECSPQAFREYVRSLHVAPVRAAPPAECSVRLNAKGTPVITVRRKPKFLLRSEIDTLAKELGWRKQDFWLEVRKRKIEIRSSVESVKGS